MSGTLQDQQGIVTGGASGIGAAVVARLLREGATVAIIDRDAAALAQSAATYAQDEPQRLICLQADITDRVAVEQAVASVANRGQIDFLVHAAGWDRPKSFLESGPDDWRTTLDINLVGALNLYHAVCRRMVAAGGGRIVGFASDAARSGAANTSLYAAAKAGLIAFSKSIARELASAGVLVNVVSPGPTDTPLFQSLAQGGEEGVRLRKGLERAIPLGRIARPDDYAGVVALLVGPDGGYITGQTISISGGLTMI